MEGTEEGNGNGSGWCYNLWLLFTSRTFGAYFVLGCWMDVNGESLVHYDSCMCEARGRREGSDRAGWGPRSGRAAPRARDFTGVEYSFLCFYIFCETEVVNNKYYCYYYYYRIYISATVTRIQYELDGLLRRASLIPTDRNLPTHLSIHVAVHETWYKSCMLSGSSSVDYLTT
jgi:hypothetical protein